MFKDINKLLLDIKEYYTQKILTYGPTPQGVDWKDENSQITRFEQLALIINEYSGFTINDIGCGYGKFFEFLKSRKAEFTYYGYDLSDVMLKKAQSIYGLNKDCFFENLDNLDKIKISDYSIASGIFNVKMDYEESDWLYYILKFLDIFNLKSLKSKKGFAFNILTKYSDKELMRKDLYYADPCFLFDYCKRNFSRNVSLLHDYNLFEFTILVRK